MARKAYSDLMRSLVSGRFVMTGEIEPLKTTRLDEIVDSAKQIKGSVVACNVTDNPRARAYMSSLVAAQAIQERAGVEAICQMTVRDRNRLALTSDLLGAAALGIKNILTMTGDHTTLGDNPQSMPVYDIDTPQFLLMIRKMVDEGLDLAGNRIEGPAEFHVGITGNPNADPLEVEVLKIERKVGIGAEFMQTQVVFDVETAKSFLREMKRSPIPILVGIFPCKSYATADYLSKSVPGINVPTEYIDRLRLAEDTDEARLKGARVDEANVEYFGGFIEELRRTTHASGVHLMTIGYEGIVRKLAQRAMPALVRD